MWTIEILASLPPHRGPQLARTSTLTGGQCIQVTKQTQRMKRLQLRGSHRTELSIVEAKIKARELCGEGYNEDRMGMDSLRRTSHSLAHGDMGDCRFPICDETVFLVVGRQRAQGD